MRFISASPGATLIIAATEEEVNDLVVHHSFRDAEELKDQGLNLYIVGADNEGDDGEAFTIRRTWDDDACEVQTLLQEPGRMPLRLERDAKNIPLPGPLYGAKCLYSRTDPDHNRRYEWVQGPIGYNPKVVIFREVLQEGVRYSPLMVVTNEYGEGIGNGSNFSGTLAHVDDRWKYERNDHNEGNSGWYAIDRSGRTKEEREAPVYINCTPKMLPERIKGSIHNPEILYFETPQDGGFEYAWAGVNGFGFGHKTKALAVADAAAHVALRDAMQEDFRNRVMTVGLLSPEQAGALNALPRPTPADSVAQALPEGHVEQTDDSQQFVPVDDNPDLHAGASPDEPTP